MSLARPTHAALVLAFGVAWAIRSAIGLQDPDYWNPVTDLDFAAVWWYSAALALGAGVIWLTGWLARSSRRSAVWAFVVGAGLLVAAVANGFEDGLGMRWVGTVYVVGAVVGGYGLIGLGILYAMAGARALAVVALTAVLGMMLHGSIGGFIVLAMSVWFATRLVRRPETLAPRGREEPMAMAADPAAADA